MSLFVNRQTIPAWEHFEHGADIGVRGVGASMAQAFEQAALALTSVVTDLDQVVCRNTLELECEAEDPEVLLVDFLNAVIYEMSIRKMLFSRFSVVCSEQGVRASICGEHVDVERHQPAVEIKGATYTELKVACDEQGVWLAQCIVDV